MSILRTALPLVLVTSVLTGCAGLQKSDWPMCAAVGGVTGAALGSIKNSTWAGWGVLVGGGVAAAYCWVHGEAPVTAKCPNVPKGTPVDADGCPLPPPPVVERPAVVKEEVIVIRDVHFEFNSAKLTGSDKMQLEKVATKLKGEAASTRLSVTGHTDSVGRDAYNQKLSDRRAHSVVDYLIGAGVPRASFVSVRGMGKSQPVADNKTADGRALNRRVEIKIDRQ
jgi:outer membrane protein OmpA-like peptidoglycan-associated protein